MMLNSPQNWKRGVLIDNLTSLNCNFFVNCKHNYVGFDNFIANNNVIRITTRLGGAQWIQTSSSTEMYRHQSLGKGDNMQQKNLYDAVDPELVHEIDKLLRETSVS